MLARPKEIAYKDVKKVLEHEGWILDRVKGSHHIYVKKDGTLYPLVLPVHGKMLKAHYIREIVELLELEEKYGEK